MLTPKVVAFLAHLEGLCLEAYRDTGGVWTWALGVTNQSGHIVYPTYLNNPQTLEECLKVSIWLIRKKYLPVVEKAFSRQLSENELAAALSFHWNTGAISTTDWAKTESETFLRSHYLNGGLLKDRRNAEANLFFHSKWPDNMLCPVYKVDRGTHRPIIGKPTLVDIVPKLTTLLI